MASIGRLAVEAYMQDQVSNDWECPVCLEGETEEGLLGHSASTNGEINHIFHETCLKNWLAQNSNCPECRQSLAAKDVKIQTAEQALIQIDLHFPGILEAPKEYTKTVVRYLQPTLVTSAALMFFGSMRGSTLLNVSHLSTGIFVAMAASYGTRELLAIERISNALEGREYIKAVITSIPFISGIAFVSAAAVFSTVGTLLYAMPAVAAGVGTHYLAQQLNQDGKISDTQKEQIQMVSAVATGALALIAPIRTVGSYLMGAAVGGFLESLLTSDRVPAQQNSQAGA